MAIVTTVEKPVVDIAAIGGALRKVLLAWQVARMRGVLDQFSDEQLAKIGISRTDIPARARQLIEGDA